MQINIGFDGKATSVYILPQDETLQAVIVAVVFSTLIFHAIFPAYFQRTRLLVKFLHQMTNSVARSKPFQGNTKYENCVQFDNLTRVYVTKRNIAVQLISNVIIS